MCMSFCVTIRVALIWTNNTEWYCWVLIYICCCYSVAKSCSTLCDPMNCSTPGFSILHYLLEFAQVHVHWVGDAHHLILCCHLLLLLSIFPRIRVFSRVSLLHQVAKYWNFSFSISPSNDYSGLISFRIDWFDLLAVRGTLKSLLQHYSLKASVLWCSAFFMVQITHPYMTTGKTIALTRQTSVGKVMSLVFNMLSRFVITFLRRSKHLLISWLQSPTAVILEPKTINSATASSFSPLFAMKWWDRMPWS